MYNNSLVTTVMLYRNRLPHVAELHTRTTQNAQKQTILV